MTSNHGQHDQTTPDPAASLRTSGRTGLFIVAAGMGLLTAIGVVRRLVGGQRKPTPPAAPPEQNS